MSISLACEYITTSLYNMCIYMYVCTYVCVHFLMYVPVAPQNTSVLTPSHHKVRLLMFPGEAGAGRWSDQRNK